MVGFKPLKKVIKMIFTLLQKICHASILLKIFITSSLMDDKMTNLNTRHIGTSEALWKDQSDVSTQPGKGIPNPGHYMELTVLIWKMGLSQGTSARQSALEEEKTVFDIKGHY